MPAPVTREKVFKIIFLFISSFKSYVNSEHKVATLKKNFLQKNTTIFRLFFSMHVFLYVLLYPSCCSRDVHNIRKLITKKKSQFMAL